MNGQERKNEKTLEKNPGKDPWELCDGASLSLTYQDLLEEVLAVAQAIEIGQFQAWAGSGSENKASITAQDRRGSGGTEN